VNSAAAEISRHHWCSGRPEPPLPLCSARADLLDAPADPETLCGGSSSSSVRDRRRPRRRLHAAHHLRPVL